MYKYCLNFKERKIEKMYEYDTITIHFDFEQDYYKENFIHINEYIHNKIQEAVEQKTKNMLVSIKIDSQYPTKITDDEKLDFLNRVARETLTEVSTGRDYLYIPPWFKNKVYLPILTQNRLGNFNNLFQCLQIELNINDECCERMVTK